MIRHAIIAALAIGAVSGAALAQTSGAGANQGRCWDSATNQVRDMNATGQAGSGSGAPPGVSSMAGGGTAGTGPSGRANNPAGAIGAGSAASSGPATSGSANQHSGAPGLGARDSAGSGNGAAAQNRPPAATGLPDCRS